MKQVIRRRRYLLMYKCLRKKSCQLCLLEQCCIRSFFLAFNIFYSVGNMHNRKHVIHAQVTSSTVMDNSYCMFNVLTACFWLWEKTCTSRVNTCRHMKNMHTPHRKPQVYMGIKPKTSCCEARLFLRNLVYVNEKKNLGLCHNS